MRTKDTRVLGIVLCFLVLLTAACGSGAANDGVETETLTIYSGRSESLVGPVIERFREKTGIDVEVRYGDTAQLAVALIEEGDATSADLFWAQDAGALGALASEQLFAQLPDSLLNRVAGAFKSDDGRWLATSGRARVIAYSAPRVDGAQVPASILDLTDPRFEGRVGWAPTNGSFQSFVSAMRELIGDEATRNWLVAMKENGAKSYPKNSAIIQGIANGEVDFGLPNHYYLYRFKDEDADFPVEQQFFEAGDPGNLVNVAGTGVMASSDAEGAALKFISFLLSNDMQSYFQESTFEYPVVEQLDEGASEAVVAVMPSIDLNSLRNLESTLTMLREVELL